eukprot:4440381-Pleurochrysis_carterae.AAC.1
MIDALPSTLKVSTFRSRTCELLCRIHTMLRVLHARARGLFESCPGFALALCDTCHAPSLLRKHASRLRACCVASRRCPVCAAHAMLCMLRAHTGFTRSERGLSLSASGV